MDYPTLASHSHDRMSSHSAVVTTGIGKPLQVLQVPTVKPEANEVRVLVEWTASTPLDLHQADGGLMVEHPAVLGDSMAGTVVNIGPKVSKVKVGDQVFGFAWRRQAEKAHQKYCVVPEFLLGKIPSGFTMQQATTVPDNFVTAWHTLTKDVRFRLPWPKPSDYVSEHAEEWILIWGGSSSCGQYLLQILKYYGYRKVIATASTAHHEKLMRYGAVKCFDYRQKQPWKQITEFVSTAPAETNNKSIAFIIDTIGSQSGSVAPVAQIAKKGCRVAVLLPVILRDAGDEVPPEYELNVHNATSWPKGVEVVGVRTHYYLENKFLAENLQPIIMPAVLELGIVEPNDQFIVEGKSMLERAEKARLMLRRKQISGARLVWRIAEDDQQQQQQQQQQPRFLSVN